MSWGFLVVLFRKLEEKQAKLERQLEVERKKLEEEQRKLDDEREAFEVERSRVDQEVLFQLFPIPRELNFSMNEYYFQFSQSQDPVNQTSFRTMRGLMQLLPHFSCSGLTKT